MVPSCMQNTCRLCLYAHRFTKEATCNIANQRMLSSPLKFLGWRCAVPWRCLRQSWPQQQSCARHQHTMTSAELQERNSSSLKRWCRWRSKIIVRPGKHRLARSLWSNEPAEHANAMILAFWRLAKCWTRCEELTLATACFFLHLQSTCFPDGVTVVATHSDASCRFSSA